MKRVFIKALLVILVLMSIAYFMMALFQGTIKAWLWTSGAGIGFAFLSAVIVVFTTMISIWIYQDSLED